MYGANGGSGASLADIAALMNGGGNNNLAELMALMNGGGGLGGGNGWWILVILWALWGNNGMFGNRNGNNGGCGCGNGSGSGSSVTYNVGAEMQRGFDTQSIIQKLDGISNGICSLGYDQLNQMNGINSTVQQTGFNIIQALQQLGITDMQSFNALMSLIQQTACNEQAAVADLKYTTARNTDQITSVIQQVAQNIMQNDNANYRQMHDEIIGLRIQDMRDQLQQKDTLINMLNLKQSQAGQTADIINGVISQLRNCPVGTYNVCNPNTGSPVASIQQQLATLLTQAAQQNNGCGCGNGTSTVTF